MCWNLYVQVGVCWHVHPAVWKGRQQARYGVVVVRAMQGVGTGGRVKVGVSGEKAGMAR